MILVTNCSEARGETYLDTQYCRAAGNLRGRALRAQPSDRQRPAPLLLELLAVDSPNLRGLKSPGSWDSRRHGPYRQNGFGQPAEWARRRWFRTYRFRRDSERSFWAPHWRWLPNFRDSSASCRPRRARRL